MKNQLTRSRENRMLGGVCGGLAAFIHIPSFWVRLFFILLSLGDGIGILIYAVLWLILPNADDTDTNIGFKSTDFSKHVEDIGRDIHQATSNPHPNTQKFIGFGLIVVGIFYLIKWLNLPWLVWINRELLFPILLIMAGVVLLIKSFSKKEE